MKIVSLALCFLTLLCCQHTPMVPEVHPIEQMSDSAFTQYLFALSDSLNRDTRPDFERELDADACLADLHILKRILEEAQTPLYRYASKKEIDSVFQEAFIQTRESTYYLDFIKSMARIQNLIACGHSGWSHHADYFAYRDSAVQLFPFGIKRLKNQWYIKHNNSLNPDIPDFIQLTHINQQPVDSIAKQLRKLMYRDGNAALGTAYDLENSFTHAYSNFIAQPRQFELKTRNEEGETGKYKARALLKPVIDSIRRVRYGTSRRMGLPLRFQIIDSLSTGIYTIKWFRKEYIRYMGQHFRNFTDSVFAELSRQHISKLVIDIRDNPGGWTAHGRYLFSYFVNTPQDYINRIEIKKPDNFSFHPIITQYPGYTDTFNLKPNLAGLYEWVNYPSLKVRPAQKNRFKGKVFIGTNGGTRSCGSVFASLMQDHTDAIISGEETGSVKSGTGGMVMSIRLPYSGLTYHFTTARYSLNVKDEDASHGVIPNIEIHPDREDFIQGTDPLIKTIKKGI
ncbi:MAG: S41 family peptidase [Owenweeksia sp.]